MSMSFPGKDIRTTSAEIMAAAASLKAAKRELRSAMKTRLSSIPRAAIDSQSRCIFESLATFRPYVEAERISVYLSMPAAEVQTDAIVRDALHHGKAVFVPYLYRSGAAEGPTRIMDMVRLRDMQDFESLERDSWGIPTIDSESVAKRERILEAGDHDRVGHVEEGLDVMLMPGVAFEKDGAAVQRLGHGKGFYDFFLHRYRQAYAAKEKTEPMKLYGLALEEQVSKDERVTIPVGPHDSSLNGLITGDGKIMDFPKS
ncbi:MAG: hypothetical protein M1818_003629 [Claussenomyces sp. TS43310]|nr:MAG: hypothetical protein M1818_003629 [Claussenomyces sp. TS43310]